MRLLQRRGSRRPAATGSRGQERQRQSASQSANLPTVSCPWQCHQDSQAPICTPRGSQHEPDSQYPWPWTSKSIIAVRGYCISVYLDSSSLLVPSVRGPAGQIAGCRRITSSPDAVSVYSTSVSASQILLASGFPVPSGLPGPRNTGWAPSCLSHPRPAVKERTVTRNAPTDSAHVRRTVTHLFS